MKTLRLYDPETRRVLSYEIMAVEGDGTFKQFGVATVDEITTGRGYGAVTSRPLTDGYVGLVGEIRLYAGPFAPVGWHICDGSVLNIADYPTLYSIIGPLYGGNGETTFALPDLRGRVPIQAGQGTGLSEYSIGVEGGAESATLTTDQLPSHSHSLWADPAVAEEPEPVGAVLAQEPTGSSAMYNIATPTVQMAAASIGSTGEGDPVDIRQPYLPINFIIHLR